MLKAVSQITKEPIRLARVVDRLVDDLDHLYRFLFENKGMLLCREKTSLGNGKGMNT